MPNHHQTPGAESSASDSIERVTAQAAPTRPHPSHYGETTRAQVALWHLEQVDRLRGLRFLTAEQQTAIDEHLQVVEQLQAAELEDIDAQEAL